MCSSDLAYGLDFSRNLTNNVELHGELAWQVDARRQVISASGQRMTVTGDAINWLVGVRYLTEQDTTWIVEYYRNGSGCTTTEMTTYYQQVEQAWDTWQTSGNAAQLQQLGQNQAYTRPAAMRDYLYARVSQKEPFDILYVTPAVTAITNLQDHSLSLTPELVYTGITNLELRLKGTVLIGSRGSEYGEKVNDTRVEVRARWYF